jgi:curved DNA-binding protein
MEYKDYYKIMQVDRKVTQDEIKRSYRKLARKYHPDVSSEKDAESHFKDVGEAYEVLKDPEKRAAYDQLGSNWQTGEEFRPPPDWEAASEFSDSGRARAEEFGFSDFFESLYGQQYSSRGRSHRGMHVGGEDIHAKIRVELEDSFSGATRSITLQTPELSPDGRLLNRSRTLNVQIPKGIRQGQQIRLAGQGGMGIGEGKKGDLYLEVQFKPHPRYRVEGGDLYVTLPVSPWEAALGDSIHIPTPAGAVGLKIPPGSQTGKKLRLKRRGLPGKSPGDLYVELSIVNPPTDTEKAREVYRELGQQFDFNPRVEMEATIR